MAAAAYIATIRRIGDHFVALDEQGNRRAWGDAAKAPATKGRKLAEYLFHANEIGNVRQVGRDTCVEILAGE